MWLKIPLGQVSTISGGTGFPETLQGNANGDYLFIKVSDMNSDDNRKYINSANNYLSKSTASSLGAKVFPKGTIVFAKVGAALYLNKRRITVKDTIIDNNMMGIKPHDDVDAEFLYQYLLSVDLGEFVQPGALPSVNQSLVSSIGFPDILKPVQEKVGSILLEADRCISKTQALIAKYENIKQGMMQDLFTRGVDENGQLRPSYEEAPHLYQETELGWIPKEWLMEELRHFVPKAEYGVSISCDDSAENVPVLRMNNIFNGEFDVSDLKYAPEQELTGLFMKEKDVLFNRTNSWEHVGKTAIWKNQLEKASFASYMVRLIPNKDLMVPEYLSYWLQLDDIQTAIRRFATPGVQQVNINPTNLRRTLCSAPKDTSEQLTIVSRVQSIDEKIEKERQILAKLRSQKLGLMQDLLTGKVRVAEDREERKEAVA